MEVLGMPNNPSYRKIKLTQGKYALVDATDYEWLNKRKWHAEPNRNGMFYAVTSRRKGEEGPVRMFMHRLVLGLHWTDKRQGDHREPKHTLDNRRRNLRIATCGQQIMNRRMPKHNTSGFKGVESKRGCATFIARVRLQRREYYKSGFKTARAAFRWYVAKVRELHGEFARIR
jgi:hypothetical protein